MNEIIPFIKDLAIMLGIASIVVVLFQKIRQPVVLGYIIAGIIIGPYTPPYSLVTDITQIHTLSELGVIFLMFAIGLDFSFHKLRNIGFSAVITGIIKTILVAILGVYLAHFIGLGTYEALFFGAALSISSTTIIAKSIEDLKLKGKRFTDIVFGVLIVEDLLAVLMLTSLSTILVTKHIFSLDMLFASIKLIVVIGSWFILGYFIVPLLFRRIINYVSAESLTIVSIALCLLMAVIAAYFNYSTALGAFIMGSILAETPLAKRITQLTNPLRDLFAAVFFISVGMLIDIQNIFEHWQLIFGLSLLAVAARVIITVVGTFLTGQSINTSIRSGFSMSPIGEFSFIIMGLGLSLGAVKSSTYQIIIGMAAITTLISPYLIKVSKIITNKLDQHLSEHSKYLLDSYSAWVYRALANYKKHVGYRKFMFRLVFNGIIIGAIFYATGKFVLPHLSDLIGNNHLAKTYSWILAILISSPFIWGMLFGCNLIDKNRRVPALFLSWSITFLEIAILSIAYFSSWYIPMIVMMIITILFASFYKNLGEFYHWLEWHLSHMLKRKNQQKQSKYEELAPWDTHLVEINVTNGNEKSLAGKTLNENQIRQKFGINIVAIRRGSNVLLTPRGEEQILLGDELVVLGNDEQIDAFRQVIEDSEFDLKRAEVLKEFSLHALLLDEESPFIGKSIRESSIREKSHGIVVGLERRGFRRLNPDPATTLKVGDFLLIVGKASNKLS